MKKLNDKFRRESIDFDRIYAERFKNNQIPDIQVDFENKYFYNNIWRNSVFLRTEYGPFVKWIIESLLKANVKSVVELGCGNGWLSLELARAKLKVTGIDISQESIRIAKNYLSSLPERNNLSLQYINKNILDFQEYSGESIVCLGFLHHLPKEILVTQIEFLEKKMKEGQLLIAIEPRYDFVNYNMATLIYALRIALPNHFKYPEVKNSWPEIVNIYNELGEIRKEQSVMDNESPSQFIYDTIKKYYKEVTVEYSTAFYDKIIGGMRLHHKDTIAISDVLKKLDNLIVKYNKNFARSILIKAYKK